MSKPVFISYSTNDTVAAEQIRDGLESAAIPCWMAPRDIAPGQDYGTQIIEAIEACTALVLVLSESSNDSIYVRKEVERAIAKRKVVIPVRIQPVTVSRSLEFFISDAQWIDAWQVPLTAKVELLAAALHNYLRPPVDEVAAKTTGGPDRAPSASPYRTTPPFLETDDQPLAHATELVVAREHELSQLEGFLAEALNGHGQVVFVTGGPGRGKSTLVRAFARAAQARGTDLLVAGGACDSFTGAGDPYLPFRMILSLLTGELEASWRAGALSTNQAVRLWQNTPHAIESLVNLGPDLIDVFVAGPFVLKQARLVAPAGMDWLARLERLVSRQPARQTPTPANQTNLFQQYSQVLATIARGQPLVLLLDDLQWADQGSIDLLFHLGRQLAAQRILIVGSYRPNDVALGRDGVRHPLEAVVNEFQRLFGNDQIDLRQAEGRPLVEAMIDSEPNRLGPAFREALYEHTRGHALFTVEMLRTMQARGDLVKDATGLWVAGPNPRWDQLPARVEGVIAERISRLPADLQTLLKIASVEGAEFTAEVVARVLKADEREIVRQLSGSLDQQHQLVQSQGSQRLGRQRLSHYRFRHILFQNYLYQSIDTVERAYWHEDIGITLEQLYGDQTGAIAVHLARHYAEAGVAEKAVTYLMQAGDRAYRLSANQEALHYYQVALGLVKEEQTYDAVLAQRAKVHLDLYQGAAAVADYQHLLKRARALNDREQELEFLLGLARAQYLVALDDQTAISVSKVRELVVAAQALANELGSKRNRVRSLLASTWLTDFWPEYRKQAGIEAREGLDLSRELDDKELMLASRLAVFATANLPKEIALGEVLVAELQSQRDWGRLNTVYFHLMWAYYELGNFARMVACCQAGIDLAATLGVPPVMYPTLQSLAFLGLGRFGEAWASLQQEVADDAHAFGRAFKDFGIGMYLFDLCAYAQAAVVFEQVISAARRLDRIWLERWARLKILQLRILTGQADQSDRVSVAHMLADAQKHGWKFHHNGLLLLVQSEIARVDGDFEMALRTATEASVELEANDRQMGNVTALEAAVRVILLLQRPADAQALCEKALGIALTLGYLPMIWRLRAAMAQALALLGQPAAATREVWAARAALDTMAATIDDPELKRGFLADPLVVSILGHVDAQEKE